jgi:hypothetical protein
MPEVTLTHARGPVKIDALAFVGRKPSAVLLNWKFRVAVPRHTSSVA